MSDLAPRFQGSIPVLQLFFIAINYVSGLLDLVADIVFLSSTTDGAVAGAVIYLLNFLRYRSRRDKQVSKG